MNTYIITYDLTDGGDYAGLHGLIKSCAGWVCITQSTWGVQTSETPSQVLQHLKPALGSGDKVLVVTVSKPFKPYGLDAKTVAWLEENL